LRLARTGGSSNPAASERLDQLGQALERIVQTLRSEAAAARAESAEAAASLRREIGGTLQGLHNATESAARSLREETQQSLATVASQLLERAKLDSESQRTGLAGFATHLQSFGTTVDSRMQGSSEGVNQALLVIRTESGNAAVQTRRELAGGLEAFQQAVTSQLGTNAADVQAKLVALTEANEMRLEAVRSTVDERLMQLQVDNGQKLEQMRQTVDEKLQGTLERRLGESFKLVSDRLEQVHKGLGDMQTLASGVGDLKKVLTNVKTRGTWGEVQLGNLLEQSLTADQFARNVAVVPTSSERVEFAIKLPGRGDDAGEVVWLPIDSKCPLEDYQRLVDAAERADAEAVRENATKMEARIKACAKDIASKYIAAPHTTDFGILFVPTEGLYAELLRVPGLAETLQNEHRVLIAGPTTLTAILNSLQMGFRTLAIQKRSSEVWKVLSSVKTEFGKFGSVLDKVKKQLNTASNTIDEASRRTRAMERTLRGVDQLSASEAKSTISFEMLPESDDDESEPQGELPER
jgi:DNA recombination protein RmuC